MLQHHGTGGGSTNVLNDSSFIQKLDPRLAEPFKQGFADSMQTVFLLGAGIMVLCFLMVLFIKEVPLRQVSGLEARAAEAAQAAGDAGDAAPAADAVAADTAEGGTAPTGTAVRGTVRDGDGSPVGQAVVTLIDVAGRQLGRTVSDEDGHYAVEVPVGGTYVLIGSAGARQPQAATVVVGDTPLEFDVTLSGAAGLTGSVLDAEGGNALPGALVVATDFKGEVVAKASADEDGGFSFGDLVPGSYTLAVSAEGHRPTALPVEVANGTPNWYEVQLAPGARITGTVRTADGRPLDDARVTLLDPAGNVVGTATTGTDGEYGFTDLNGGDYTVIASGYAPVATPLRLEAEGQEDFDIDLSHDTNG
jgi:protocatechuate 3,4-dioxygenase beta subunit